MRGFGGIAAEDSALSGRKGDRPRIKCTKSEKSRKLVPCADAVTIAPSSSWRAFAEEKGELGSAYENGRLARELAASRSVDLLVCQILDRPDDGSVERGPAQPFPQHGIDLPDIAVGDQDTTCPIKF